MTKSLARTTIGTPGIDQLEAIETWVADLASTGVTILDDLPDLAATITRARELADQPARKPADLTSLRADLSRQLVDGAVKPDAAVKQLEKAVADETKTREIRELLTDAANVAGKTASRTLVNNAEQIMALLNRAHDQILDEFRKAAARVPEGITTAEAATVRRVGDHWQNTVEAYERWNSLGYRAHEFLSIVDSFARRTQRAGVPKLSGFEALELRFNEYEKLATIGNRASYPHQWLWLLDALNAEAEPRLLTPAQADENVKRDRARAQQKAREEAGPVRDTSTAYTMPANVMREVIDEAEAFVQRSAARR